MSALDDAIARHATHGAASGFDPLTDSLGDQLGYGPGPVHLREGWEHEPIEVRFPRWAVALCLGLAILGSIALSGCSTLGPQPAGFADAKPASPLVQASCPPLQPLKRVDADALALRVAEVERWYELCRAAALQGNPAQAPRIGVQP